MTTVFIDGSAGTTGLRIYERLTARRDIELITLSDELRKDKSARQDAMSKANITFLCLPDDAAREAAILADSTDTVVIDTSTAHRTLDCWTYGMPELMGMREKISASKRIANPGCHASGFIALMAPLVDAGIVKGDELLSCMSVTGYSGGGKKMIAEYESEYKSSLLSAPRQYGLSQSHKHLKEMAKMSGLDNPPVFCPVVSNFYSGMEVTVPLFASRLNGCIDDIKEVYRLRYHGPIVHFEDSSDENGFISSNALSGRDDMQISVYGNEERIILVSRFDNLGKGASGAAIQNMNIVLGVDETTGLIV